MENTNVKNIVTDGTKSKKRVKEFGEVFTPANIVNDMIDAIPMDGVAEVDLAKTWLEPACGTGNFLVEILNRRLKLVDELPEHERLRNAFIAVSGIYGIDIQKDNVEESKARMFEILCDWYKERTEVEITKDRRVKKVFEYVLDKNIVWGNGLTYREKEGLLPGSEIRDGHPLILFTEWNMDGDSLTQKEYTMESMVHTPGGSIHNVYETVNFLRADKAKKTVNGDDIDINDLYKI